jgi:hypothetical protein
MIDTTQTPTTDATPLSELIQMMNEGAQYRRTETVELFGQPVTLVLKPVPNEVYYPALTAMMEDMKISETEAKALAEEATDMDAGEVATLPDSFVGFMKEMCRNGIDYEAMGGDASMLEQAFGDDVETFGPFVIEVGEKIQEVTDSLEDAENFR